MQTAYELFYDLFLSLELWGYFGPFALVVVGYYLSMKDKFLTTLWFIIELLVVSFYLGLVGDTPAYWWHVFILLLGGLATCAFSYLDR